MPTQCTTKPLEFEGHGSRRVVADFDGGPYQREFRLAWAQLPPKDSTNLTDNPHPGLDFPGAPLPLPDPAGASRRNRLRSFRHHGGMVG